MRKILLVSTIVLAMLLGFGCQDDNSITPTTEEDTRSEFPADSRCNDSYDSCYRYNNSNPLKPIWYGILGYYDPFPATFTLNSGEEIELHDTICVNNICSNFEIEWRNDATYKAHYDVVLSEDPPLVYTDSIVGEYYICWCFKSDSDGWVQYYQGEIILQANGEEVANPFMRFTHRFPLTLKFPTEKGVFDIYIQDEKY